MDENRSLVESIAREMAVAEGHDPDAWVSPGVPLVIAGGQYTESGPRRGSHLWTAYVRIAQIAVEATLKSLTGLLAEASNG